MSREAYFRRPNVKILELYLSIYEFEFIKLKFYRNKLSLHQKITLFCHNKVISCQKNFFFYYNKLFFCHNKIVFDRNNITFCHNRLSFGRNIFICASKKWSVALKLRPHTIKKVSHCKKNIRYSSAITSRGKKTLRVQRKTKRLCLNFHSHAIKFNSVAEKVFLMKKNFFQALNSIIYR